MPVNFTIKQGDTLPRVRATLLAPGGAPQDLTAATAVKFNLWTKAHVLVIDHGTVTIIDAPTGVVEYAWQTGDTVTVGDYEFEFEVTFGPGQIETYPNARNKRLRIFQQIA